jgi:hypothetical protein
MNFPLNVTRYLRYATVLIIVLGGLQRLVIWTQQRSIFLDESNLIRNL